MQKKRFENDSHITILHGDSGDILKNLVRQIDQPALYWLDGHYSSEFFMGDRYIRTAKGEKVTPIIKELKVLLHDKHRHVILIDDARLFNGESDYPKVEEVAKIVGESPYRFKMTVRNDIIRIVPEN